MKLSEYAKKRGVTISLALVAEIELWTKQGLNTMYERDKNKEGGLDLLDAILDDAQERFESIVRGSKLKLKGGEGDSKR
jgi:hypothetical protein